METTKYIESGILELYVFGKLSAAEEREVLKNASQYPEIKTELARVEAAFEQYALARGITPPPGTLTNILQEINMNTATAAPAQMAAASSSNVYNYLFAALSALGLLGAYYFYNQAGQTETALINKTETLETLEKDCDTIKKLNIDLQKEINIISNIKNKSILMSATGKYESTPAIAAVYYNEEEGTAYLDTKALPAPPKGKQYQLWAIVDGKPVDMGVFDLAVEQDISLQTVPYVAEAQAFAVTIEDEGGVESPTLEEMIVVGTVG